MKEIVIISLTTWSKRIGNIPVVLDTIYSQTYLPDKVVLNLAYGEIIPEDVADYLQKHDVEIYFTEDTKVYKKFIPTLKRYPDACVINIDDDFIYPNTMIEEFMTLHEQYPQYPISGNHVALNGMQCHCGCASLTKAEYFGNWLDKIDEELRQHCPSSDIIYTYLATQNGHPYIHTNNEYFVNGLLKPIEIGDGYSSCIIKNTGIEDSYSYLVNRFGQPKSPLPNYTNDKYIAQIIENILQQQLERRLDEMKVITERRYQSSKAYRLGRFLLTPFRWTKRKK